MKTKRISCHNCDKFILSEDISNKAAKVVLLTVDGYFTDNDDEAFVKIYLCKRCSKTINNK